MDAVEFLRVKRTICQKTWRTNNNCVSCPLYALINDSGFSCGDSVERNPEKAVEIVEKWLKENPTMSNKDKFEELFGRAIPMGAIFGGAEIIPISWWDEPYKKDKECFWEKQEENFVWNKDGIYTAVYKCSNCGGMSPFNTKFCPFCGREMMGQK